MTPNRAYLDARLCRCEDKRLHRNGLVSLSAADVSARVDGCVDTASADGPRSVAHVPVAEERVGVQTGQWEVRDAVPERARFGQDLCFAVSGARCGDT
jgi:hypothetical protein